jgi:hypothetical protein
MNSHHIRPWVMRAIDPVTGFSAMHRKIGQILAVFICTLAMSGPVLADGTIVRLLAESDFQIIADFNARREHAIAVASASPDRPARDAFVGLMEQKSLPIADRYDPKGSWRCRYFKTGGGGELVVYAWFACRIHDDGAGWVIEKSGGSQRSKGRLYNYTDTRLLYLGALHEPGESSHWFGDSFARNQIALLSALGDGRMRLEFPAPLPGSEFDVLEFRRN